MTVPSSLKTLRSPMNPPRLPGSLPAIGYFVLFFLTMALLTLPRSPSALLFTSTLPYSSPLTATEVNLSTAPRSHSSLQLKITPASRVAQKISFEEVTNKQASKVEHWHVQSSPCLLVPKSTHMNAYCIPSLQYAHKCFETPDDPWTGAAVKREGAESRRMEQLCQSSQARKTEEHATGMDNGLWW